MIVDGLAITVVMAAIKLKFRALRPGSAFRVGSFVGGYVIDDQSIETYAGRQGSARLQVLPEGP